VATGVLTPVPTGDTADTIAPLSENPTVAPTAPGAADASTNVRAPMPAPEAATRVQPAAASPVEAATRVQPAAPATDHPTVLSQAPGATGGSGASRPIGMLAAGQTIGPRYHIIRLLGVGGMGAVYHAWDAELGVAVAIKVIRPDMTADPEAAAMIERRFKRELLLARQVTHKNVVRIHDMGDVDGMKYITMPYVQGSDLLSVLRQAGRLPIPRALHYARQIVDGLAAAHDAGVVHRDLKPANVMIDGEDQALIMDFGIARSTDGSAGTVNGRVVGTLAYMAPEQAQGKATDQRADIYALGMMLAEMLVGRRAAAATEQDAIAELMARMKEPPPRIRAVDPAMPEPLDALVARCVEPDPDQRFSTTRELAAALDTLDENGHLIVSAVPVAPARMPRWRLAAIGAAALVVVAAAAAMLARRTTAPVAVKAIDPVSILVADFDNKTGDAVFDGALEQPLTIAMEGASFITSYARRDALRIAQAQHLGNASHLDGQTARLVAFREGIKYVLAGSVAASGGKFQMQLDAIDPAGGQVAKTAGVTAASKADVLAAVGSLAAKIRTGLGDTSTDTAKRAVAETFTASSLDAMREYSQAQDLQDSGRNEEALAHYRKAIEFDPKFGRAYSGAANVTYRLGRREEADALWKQALAQMDRMTDREKYRTLGAYNLGIAQNYEQAKDNYTALIAAYPSDGRSHANLAMAYFYLHDFAKAAVEGQRGVELDRTNQTAKSNQALYAMYAGDFAGGAAMAKKVIAENATMHKPYLPIAVAAALGGDAAGAAKAYDDMAKTGAAGASLASSGRADLALYTGRIDEAKHELAVGQASDRTAKITTGAAVKQIALAEAEIAAGRRQAALDAVKEALALSKQPATLVPAARVLLRAGKAADARAIAADLESQLQKQNRAYGKILLAEIALEEKKVADATDLLIAARSFSDVWLGRFDLGVAYVQAGHFSEAVSELEACEKRRGEATALFFDDVPTLRYLATLPYWIGRAQEGLGMSGPAKTRYEAFLALRSDAKGDPLVEDARRRTTSSTRP